MTNQSINQSINRSFGLSISLYLAQRIDEIMSRMTIPIVGNVQFRFAKKAPIEEKS
jgi:hypothetical protein